MSDRITRDEMTYALEEICARFAGMAMTDRERNAYVETLRPYAGVEVFAAIDVIARSGRPRPKPNELALAIHAARPRQRPGPFLDEIPDDELTPNDEIAGRVDELRALLSKGA